METSFSEKVAIIVSATPLVSVGALCSLFNLLGGFLTVVWSVCATALLRTSDFWTKLLPEQNIWADGRVAWVTGASSGIGLSLCKQLALRRCTLIMSSRRLEDLQVAAEEVQRFCASRKRMCSEKDFILLPFELADPKAVEEAVKEADLRTHGKIDFLFNNAGIMLRGMFPSYEASEFLLRVDLLAQIQLTKLVLPLMVKNGCGQIVFTNTLFSKVVSCGSEPYCVAKAGLISFAAALSRELAAKKLNIHVTTALLGMVKTNICLRALGSTGKPLCSDSSWIQQRIAAGQSPDVVAQLMLKAVSNKLRECWIASGVYLFFLYLQHYSPDISAFFFDIRAEAHAAELAEDARELEMLAERVRKQKGAELSVKC